jgi:hypothetical protein
MNLNYFDCLPNVIHNQLVKTCIADDKPTVQKHLNVWKKQQDFDNIDHESQKMIAFLNRQIIKFKIEDENGPRYNGIYKKSWVYNKQLVENALEILPLLKAQHIPFLIIKGIALSSIYYNDNGIIKTYGLDIYIHEFDFPKVFDVLTNNNWKLNNSKKDINFYISINGIIKQIGFHNNSGSFIVVHLKAFKMPYSSKSEALFWNSFQEFELNGLRVNSFDNTSFLFYTIINGITEHTLQWVMDVKTILNSQKEINWDKFIDLNKSFNTASIIGLAFEYLTKELSIEGIPSFVVEAINKESLYELNKANYNYYAKRTAISALKWHFLYYEMLRQNYKSWGELSYLKGIYNYFKAVYSGNKIFNLLKKIVKGVK